MLAIDRSADPECSEHQSVPSQRHRQICSLIAAVLKRIYGGETTKDSYSNTLSSLTFAGTVVGMLIFGYLSDKMGAQVRHGKSGCGLVLLYA